MNFRQVIFVLQNNAMPPGDFKWVGNVSKRPDTGKGKNMAWRVIIRFSYDGDDGSKLRNYLEPRLTKAGITNTATGLWESQNVGKKEAAAVLSAVLKALADPQAAVGAPPHTTTDHVFVALFNIDPPVKKAAKKKKATREVIEGMDSEK